MTAPHFELRPTRCAICGTEGNAAVLYPANLDQLVLDPALFSARRLPDRIHYRVVRCNSCGLVRSDPIADPSLLEQMYARADFSYSDELPNLRLTYGRYLAALSRYGARKGALLDIGCGNGFFLEEAMTHGYAAVQGIEPSATALAKAAPHVRSRIIPGVFRPGLFAAEQFDVICMFQVLDHIPDPGVALRECFRIMTPGGLVLCLSHNVESLSARLLGERSPIIDIEHTALYSPRTASRIFGMYGFNISRLSTVWNRYSLCYLASLLPLPTPPKRLILALLKGTSVGRISLTLPLGNLYLVAQKPA